MQTKNILVGLLSLTAIAEATAIHRPFDNLMNRRAARSIETRQNFGNRFGNGGFGRGGQNGGQNNGQNGGQNNGQNQGNQGNNNNNNQGQNGGNQDQTQDQNQGNNGNNNNNGNQAALTLNADALQTGSAQDGNPDTASGEAASKTDDANFINFCSGKELTNGLQKTGGSCNGIVMGQIPAKSNMVSSVLVNPQNGDDIAANQDFQIQVQVDNFAPGTFTNADNTYYTAPQDLDGSGNIIGHTHVTVQDLGGSLNPTTPLDASQFAFFKGINDDGNQQGLLSADVVGGLPAGNYRLCTMFAAANHQPVIMPVAQRGAQDDCVRFTVGANNNNNGGNNNNNNNGGNNNNNNNNGQNGQNGQNSGNGQNQGNQGQNSNDSTGDQNGNNQADNSQNSALGGIAAPAVTNSGDSSRPFSVNGNTFANEAAAIQRSCDIQQNACSDAANSGKTGFSVNDCQAQQQQCLSAAGQ
ncbi:hypothetical protein SAMD00023353_2300380 [Rosellinia necatrix]|uniref:Ribosomal protein s17 n=1 Tax=Rosellinia necatrix TaxID=77044 RepID=A0A1W2TGJ3_ROSNE|nr:hypothetical protein SAMD00023353_2300380 [Rosellinia necatrix]